MSILGGGPGFDVRPLPFFPSGTKSQNVGPFVFTPPSRPDGPFASEPPPDHDGIRISYSCSLVYGSGDKSYDRILGM